MQHSLKRFLSFSGLILGTFLLVFVFAEAVGFNFLQQVEEMDQMLLPVAALLGLALLAGDVFDVDERCLVLWEAGALFGSIFFGGEAKVYVSFNDFFRPYVLIFGSFFLGIVLITKGLS